MQKKTATKFYRALPLGLLLCMLVGVAPVFGQENASTSPPIPVEDIRVSAFFGLCFDTENPHRVCYAFALQVDLYGLALYPSDARGDNSQRFFSTSGVDYRRSALRSTWRRRANGSFIYPRGDVNATFANMWPFPDPPSMALPYHSAKAGGIGDVDVAQKESRRVDHNGTWAFTLNAVLPVPVPSVFLVEPFVGAGIAHVFAGTQEGLDYALKSTTMPVLNYGLGVTTHLKGSLDLIVQYKSIIYYANKLEYEGPDGASITRDDFDKIDASTLLIGFGVRF